MTIRDTDILDSTCDGIQFKTGGGAMPDVKIQNVRIDKSNNGSGILAMGGARGSATLTDVTITNSAEEDVTIEPDPSSRSTGEVSRRSTRDRRQHPFGDAEAPIVVVGHAVLALRRRVRRSRRCPRVLGHHQAKRGTPGPASAPSPPEEMATVRFAEAAARPRTFFACAVSPREFGRPGDRELVVGRRELHRVGLEPDSRLGCRDLPAVGEFGRPSLP